MDFNFNLGLPISNCPGEFCWAIVNIGGSCLDSSTLEALLLQLSSWEMLPRIDQWEIILRWNSHLSIPSECVSFYACWQLSSKPFGPIQSQILFLWFKTNTVLASDKYVNEYHSIWNTYAVRTCSKELSKSRTKDAESKQPGDVKLYLACQDVQMHNNKRTDDGWRSRPDRCCCRWLLLHQEVSLS